MLKTTVVLAGMALAGPAPGMHAADLQDQFQISHYPMPYEEKLRLEAAAPVIILGLVLEVNDIGQPRESPGAPGIKAQLTRVKVWVEDVIKGDVRTNLLDFYYFAFSAQESQFAVKPTYQPKYLHRRIYFLKPWEDTYRSVGDVTDHTLRVPSGLHGKGFCRGKSVGCCIAEMLLVPAQGIDTVSFEEYLFDAAYIAEVLCSGSVAAGFLRRLAQHPNQGIAERARQILADRDRQGR